MTPDPLTVITRVLTDYPHHHPATQARHVVAALDLGTCDASLSTGLGKPLGPCILRHGHNGPLHQDATGAKWSHHGYDEATARATITSLTMPDLHEAIRTLARLDPTWWRTELKRLIRTEGRRRILGGTR